MAFTRLRQIAAARGVTLVLTGLSAAVARSLGPLVAGPAVRRLATLQDGIDWMEEDALARLPPRLPPPAFAERLATVMGEAEAARLLAMLPVEQVAPGMVLMAQGEASDDVVLLEEGRVAITVRFPDGQVITLRLEAAGAMIGELGFLPGTRRTASVVAETPCRLRRLGRDGLARLERDSPDLAVRLHRLMAELLARRIEDKDRLIRGLVRGLRPMGQG